MTIDPNRRRVHYVTYDEKTGEILSKGYCDMRTVSAQYDALELEAGEGFALVPKGTTPADHVMDLSNPSDPVPVPKPAD